MKQGPLPTFNSTIRSALLNSIKETTQIYGISIKDDAYLVKRTMSMSGDYLAGIRLFGQSFQGAVILSVDKNMAKSFADKIFAGTNAKGDDAMLCDLIGEVCNQMTGNFQRILSSLGAKIKVSAQETAQNQSSFEIGAAPDEWLMIPFNYQSGRGMLSFGFVGELGIDSENAGEDLSDVQSITFF